MSICITLLFFPHAWESDRLRVVVLYRFVTTDSIDFHFMSVYYVTLFLELRITHGIAHKTLHNKQHEKQTTV